MRVCSKCSKSRWEGLKKDGKFVCSECLAEKPAEVTKAVETKVEEEETGGDE